MIIRPFLAIVPDLTKINATDAFFETVKEQFSTYVEQSLFTLSSAEAFYVYEIETPQRKHLGLVAALDLNEYKCQKVKKHEKTLIEKEKRQMELLWERGAMVKPVLLTHQSVIKLQEKLQFYTSHLAVFHEISFIETQQIHRFWQIINPIDIEVIQDLYKKEIEYCYVADGHHRLAANLHYGDIGKSQNQATFDDILCAFFAASELDIKPFHRLFKIPTDATIDIENALKPVAFLSDKSYTTPLKKGQLAICIKGQWAIWEWKPELLGHYMTRPAILDVDILNEKIFHDIFNIENIRSDKRIAYLEGTLSDAQLEEYSYEGIVFKLFPVQIQDLINVADADAVMPPKSTWFEPRMRNGLLIQEIPK